VLVAESAPRHRTTRAKSHERRRRQGAVSLSSPRTKIGRTSR
jgi:hypothetical protein